MKKKKKGVFDVCSAEGIIKLEQYIKERRAFSEKEYAQCVNYAKSKPYSSYIVHLLETKIKPMIVREQPHVPTTKASSNRLKNEMAGRLLLNKEERTPGVVTNETFQKKSILPTHYGDDKERSTFEKKLRILADSYFINGWFDRKNGEMYPSALSDKWTYDLLIRSELLPYQFSYENFCKELCRNALMVPVQDLEIKENLVVVNTSQVAFIKEHSWDEFKQFVEQYKDDQLLLQKWTTLAKGLYNEKESNFYKRMHLRKSFLIHTRLSEREFVEAFLDEREVYEFSSCSSSWQRPAYFHFPVSYMKNDENSDLSILSNIGNRLLDKVIISERYDFGKNIELLFDNLKSRLPGRKRNLNTMNRQDSFFWLETRIRGCRLCKSKHYFFKYWGKAYSEYNSDDRILEFTENCSHWSDDNLAWWYRGVERHKSFLVYNLTGNIITMIPSTKKYATYYFRINNTKKTPIELAAMVLVKYFSSDKDNKRQELEITAEWKLFGIVGFWK